jgi:hypothetical protein
MSREMRMPCALLRQSRFVRRASMHDGEHPVVQLRRALQSGSGPPRQLGVTAMFLLMRRLVFHVGDLVCGGWCSAVDLSCG